VMKEGSKKDDAAADLALIGAAQRVEHYEIAGYTTARNLAQQLIVYATGAPIRFSDRPAIGKILASSRAAGYGVRKLVHEIVQSELFLSK